MVFYVVYLSRFFSCFCITHLSLESDMEKYQENQVPNNKMSASLCTMYAESFWGVGTF